MEVDLLIKNAKIVTETAVVDGCLAIRGEKIVAISNNDETFDAANLVDARGNYLFPGAIDTHSHFFEPGDNYREDFAHGTQAAASGGFTLVLDMPNTNPPVKNEETFFLKYHAAVENCLVDFGLWGSSMADNLKNIGKLHELGCIGFKAFTIDAGPHFDYSGDYAQMKGMETVKNIGGIFGAHAENRDIIRHATELWTGNPWTPAIHDAARPWYAELSAINSLLLYAKITGCRLHICHLSIPEGAELIKKARSEGVDVTVETCPHYLVLNTELVKDKGTFAMINPPLRNPERMEKMWQFVLDGTINYIGTDHAPYTIEDKIPDNGNLWEANAGAPSIDVAIPLLLSEGVKKRQMSVIDFSKLTSTNAARRFGFYPKKGHIAIGADADFFLADMDKRWNYNRLNSFSKTKVTHFAYDNWELDCSIEATVVRGSIVYRDGKILQKPGYGKFTRV